MTSDSYNPNDPLFLISQALDDELSPAKQRAMRESLETSDELQAEADQLKRVDKLISRFAARKPSMDWDAHAEKILARIAEQCSDESLDEVDLALASWGKREIDDSIPDMADAVLQLARSERKQVYRIPWLAKIAIPLAAAAAIAITIGPSIWNQPSITPICVVQIGPQHEIATDIGEIKPRSDVRFVRVANVQYEPRPTREIGLLSVGSG